MKKRLTDEQVAEALERSVRDSEGWGGLYSELYARALLQVHADLSEAQGVLKKLHTPGCENFLLVVANCCEGNDRFLAGLGPPEQLAASNGAEAAAEVIRAIPIPVPAQGHGCEVVASGPRSALAPCRAGGGEPMSARPNMTLAKWRDAYDRKCAELKALDRRRVDQIEALMQQNVELRDALSALSKASASQEE